MSPVKPSPAKRGRGRPAGAKSKPRDIDAVVFIWPKRLEEMCDISKATRCLWERNGDVPPRDGFINGVALGWKRETIEAWLAGRLTTPRKAKRAA